MEFATKAIHVGNTKDSVTGAIVPPIHFASTYVQEKAGEEGDYDYSRSGNPTRKAFERTIASLEEAYGALAFGSGMAAIHGVLMLLNSGDHIIASSDIYGGTYRLLHKVLARSGISTSLVDARDPSKIEEAIRPETKMLWIESPGNPLFSIIDISSCAKLCKKNGILLTVDGTFATPVLTQPLKLGADFVVHSATKYIGGHSDLLGGVVAVKEKQNYDDLYYVQNATGAVMAPMDCFLASRGLKTLSLRVRAQSASAQNIATFLSTHPLVHKVFYPGLAEHPGHLLAKRQMNGGFGGVLSFEHKLGYEAAKAFVDATKIFQTAVSLGAVESIIEHPASMSHASYDRADRIKHGISDSLVRLSVGCEDIGDLLEDIEQAIEPIHGVSDFKSSRTTEKCSSL